MTASNPQRYRIFSSHSDSINHAAQSKAIESLSLAVAEFVSNGWVPVGGVALNTAHDSFTCAQAVYLPPAQPIHQ